MQIHQLITFIAAICMHSDELTRNYSVPSVLSKDSATVDNLLPRAVISPAFVW